MEVKHHETPNDFLLKIEDFVEENYLTHFLFQKAIEAVWKGKIEIYSGFTIENQGNFELIYAHLQVGHYFFGNLTKTYSHTPILESTSLITINDSRPIVGNSSYVDRWLDINNLDYSNIRPRTYWICDRLETRIGQISGKLFQATKDDLGELLPLMIEFYEGEFQGGGTASIPELIEGLKAGLINNTIWGWQLNGKIVGFLQHSPSFNKEIFIKNISISNLQRGNGYGKALLYRFAERLFQHGVIKIGLNTRSKNIPAMNLFRSVGFSESYNTGYYEHFP